MKKIYLATPYTHKRIDIMEERYEAACKAVGEIVRMGHLAYSPIVHWHPVAVRQDLPRDVIFWQKYNQSFLDWADELWVKAMAGWSESKGLRQEIDYANSVKKPVFFF